MQVLGQLARSGVRFPVMVERDIAAQTSGTPADTLAAFAAHVDDSTAPPGPTDSWLGETVVHATDIRWPLGLEHPFPTDALVRVAEF